MVMGVSPVIGYLFFKETEIKNARLIITGVKNKIQERLLRKAEVGLCIKLRSWEIRTVSGV